MSIQIVLVNTYELGRQPFGLAHPAALLRSAGHQVHCVDLSIDPLPAASLASADLVALHLPMHTATRIAVDALPKIRGLAPDAALCAYGLYAPVNEGLLRSLGVNTVLGGEFEPGIESLAQRLSSGGNRKQAEPVINLKKIEFVPPDRSDLPGLDRYASIILPDGSRRTTGFTESSRGCKHLCRHCPVVPVYQGRFRIVPVEIVMDDVRNQVAAGASHISFGDPDFLNGPTHALRIIRALHAEFPQVSYDVTVKIEHLLSFSTMLEELAETGCLFITTAVESVDDQVLIHLAKGHTREDFFKAVGLLRDANIGMAPTFVPFTPWTSLESYVDLLETLIDLRLVECVPPVQLSIRLLVPSGSYLFELPGFDALVEAFDEDTLGYPWRHQNPEVDRLQSEVHALVAEAEKNDESRRETFEKIYQVACGKSGKRMRPLPEDLGVPIGRHSEPWYCCAEPTDRQLVGF